MAEYYTYKKQVPIKAGEKLGFTPGRGYYAIPAPTPAKTSAAAKQASTEELGGLTVTQAEQVAGNYGLTTTTSSDGSRTSTATSPPASTSKPPTKHAVQPRQAPTAAAKTPTAAETAAKDTSADSYRPTVFKTSAKAKPNSALIEASHRQGGTVAHPAAAAKTTKPATANTKKHEITPTRTTVSASAKKLVQTTTPASKHPALATTPTYHTYKKDVHLKPGQSLAYTPGKGYHARDVRDTIRPAETTQKSSRGLENGHGTPSRNLQGRTRSGERERLGPGPGNAPPRPQKPKQPGHAAARGTPPNLTPKELIQARKLRSVRVGGHKIANPDITVAAATREGLALPIACALLTLESFGGQNVWGTDPSIFAGGLNPTTGKYSGKKYAYTHTVTQEAYNAYKAQRDRTGEQQGVGPTMLTTAALQDEADALGGAWKPYPNMLVGFRDFLTLLHEYHSIYAAAFVYNAGSLHPDSSLARSRAETYASKFVDTEKAWASHLGG